MADFVCCYTYFLDSIDILIFIRRRYRSTFYAYHWNMDPIASYGHQDDIHDNIRQVPISVYKPINDITAARNQANRYVSKYKFAKFSAERPGVEISLRTRQVGQRKGELQKSRLRTDGRTDGRTDRPTDRPTDL